MMLLLGQIIRNDVAPSSENRIGGCCSHTLAPARRHLCGLGDQGQLPVLRVPPAKQAAVPGDGQAAVSVRADLLDGHAGELAAHLLRRGADAVVAQT